MTQIAAQGVLKDKIIFALVVWLLANQVLLFVLIVRLGGW